MEVNDGGVEIVVADEVVDKVDIVVRDGGLLLSVVDSGLTEVETTGTLGRVVVDVKIDVAIVDRSGGAIVVLLVKFSMSPIELGPSVDEMC